MARPVSSSTKGPRRGISEEVALDVMRIDALMQPGTGSTRLGPALAILVGIIEKLDTRIVALEAESGAVDAV